MQTAIIPAYNQYFLSFPSNNKIARTNKITEIINTIVLIPNVGIKKNPPKNVPKILPNCR